MNLSIDIGNTLIKAAVFNGAELIQYYVDNTIHADSFVSRILAEHKINRAIISSVADFSSSLLDSINNSCELLILEKHTALPVCNLYLTPETLGKDRIAGICGAAISHVRKNVLVIDAGTCIKYDILNERNEYLGGGISPGIKMRYQALNDYTHLLPHLNPVSVIPMPGNSTENSIHSGIMGGVIAEIKGVVEEYEKKFQNLCVILTGGDLEFIRPAMSGKNSFFADPFLILKGLNYILKHNEGK
jgi:type III pantothenate kinase